MLLTYSIFQAGDTTLTFFILVSKTMKSAKILHKCAVQLWPLAVGPARAQSLPRPEFMYTRQGKYMIQAGSPTQSSAFNSAVISATHDDVSSSMMATLSIIMWSALTNLI